MNARWMEDDSTTRKDTGEHPEIPNNLHRLRARKESSRQRGPESRACTPLSFLKIIEQFGGTRRGKKGGDRNYAGALTAVAF